VTPSRSMYLGAVLPPAGGSPAPLQLPPQHLVTHGVVLGMTGSGKTGLLMVMVEEALRSQVPVLMIDVKGDLPNLLLSFPSFASEEFTPWVEGAGSAPDVEVAAQAVALAAEREREFHSQFRSACAKL
jgi:DNA helicase HerA-like ATPase